MRTSSRFVVALGVAVSVATLGAQASEVDPSAVAAEAAKEAADLANEALDASADDSAADLSMSLLTPGDDDQQLAAAKAESLSAVATAAGAVVKPSTTSTTSPAHGVVVAAPKAEAHENNSAKASAPTHAHVTKTRITTAKSPVASVPKDAKPVAKAVVKPAAHHVAEVAKATAPSVAPAKKSSASHTVTLSRSTAREEHAGAKPRLQMKSRAVKQSQHVVHSATALKAASAEVAAEEAFTKEQERKHSEQVAKVAKVHEAADRLHSAAQRLRVAGEPAKVHEAKPVVAKAAKAPHAVAVVAKHGGQKAKAAVEHTEDSVERAVPHKAARVVAHREARKAAKAAKAAKAKAAKGVPHAQPSQGALLSVRKAAAATSHTVHQGVVSRVARAARAVATVAKAHVSTTVKVVAHELQGRGFLKAWVGPVAWGAARDSAGARVVSNMMQTGEETEDGEQPQIEYQMGYEQPGPFHETSQVQVHDVWNGLVAEDEQLVGLLDEKESAGTDEKVRIMEDRSMKELRGQSSQSEGAETGHPSTPSVVHLPPPLSALQLHDQWDTMVADDDRDVREVEEDPNMKA